MIIASMDIEKFYPNILSLQSAQIIRKMWEELEMIMDAIDVDILCKYLGKHLKPNEVAEEEFEDLLYKKKVDPKKVLKKVVRKTVKSSQIKKKVSKKVKRIVKDTLSRKGDDTLNTNTEKCKEKNMDINTNKGADTLNFVEYSKNPVG